MAPRLDLQKLLENLLGSRNVYFQPPPSLKMNYPCIVYKKDDVDSEFADNNPYKHMKKYEVTVIDQDPDSATPDKVAQLPMCSYNRNFTADDLNHDVFSLYF